MASATIRVYNTLSKQKEVFETIKPGRVGIYLCGPTVYSNSHIGHMVGPVIFDTIKRYLAFNGYDVRFVINITDVDDKIINQAAKEGVRIDELADRVTHDYQKHLRSLHVQVDEFPKATAYIHQMQEMIAVLIQKRHAYAVGGDVYFDVMSFPGYGKLSKRRVEDLLAGTRKEVSDIKKSPADFALWKGAKTGEPAWDSPWGPGRPGWHIECSVMSKELLGETFDIHGGGLDLVFPHHEDEIAQSECCHGKTYAKYWLHNGLMQYTNEARKIGARADDFGSQEAGKMSKSKGNIVALTDLFAKFSPELIRYFLLSTHYRSPINFSDDRLREVGAGLARLQTFAELFERVTGKSFYTLATPAKRVELKSAAGDFESAVQASLKTFLDAMDDDFNTGVGVATVGELVGLLNKFASEKNLDSKNVSSADRTAFESAASVLKVMTNILGVMIDPPVKSEGANDDLTSKLMELFIALRQEARASKNFALSDRIRDGLAERGVVLEDGRDGTRWKLGP